MIIVIVVIFFLIKPLWRSLGDLRQELAGKEKEVSKLEELLTEFAQLKNDYQTEKEVIDKIILSLPKQKDMPFLLTQFETISSKNTLVLESLTLGQPAEKKRVVSAATAQVDSQSGETLIKSVPLDLRLVGTYSALKSFLTDIKESIRSLEVISINFKPISLTGQISDLFEFNLSLIVYYQ